MDNSNFSDINQVDMILAKKSHRGHIVQFYDNDEELASSVTSFIAPALLKNEGAIIIATELHRQAFERELSAIGLDVSGLKKSKQLILLDAAETLAAFVVDKIPNPEKFQAVIGAFIDEMSKSFPHTNAYGEMVGILWDAGNVTGTVLLEQLWNDLAKVKSFTLLCGYGTCQFKEADQAAHFSQICQEHSHVIPAGKTGAEGYTSSHFKVIAELQQREKALQHEVEERKRAEENLQKEIEERKRIELELRRNQIDLNDFFDNAIVGLHWVGPDGTILRANKTELELLGYAESEYVGRHIAEFHADSDVIGEILKRLGCHQTLQDYPARLKCKDGSIKHVLIDSNVFWEEGQFKHTRCFTRDVTAKKEADEAMLRTERHLKESEEELRTMANAIPQLAWMAKADGHIFWYNDKWYEYTGTTAQEMEGWGWQSVHDPKMLPMVLSHWTDSIKTGKPFEMTFPLRAKDGTFRSFLTRVNPFRDSSGEIVRWFGTNTDVEDAIAAQRKLKDSEEHLRKSQDQLASVVAISRVGFYDWNVPKDQLEFSDQMKQDWGIDTNLTLNEALALIHSDDRERTNFLINEAMEKRQPYRTEYRVVRRDGSVVWIEAQGQITYDEKGNPIRFFGTSLNITERKEFELRLADAKAEAERAKEEAEHANELKSAFLANMSHEIRTPLGAIVGFTDLLRDPGLSREEHANYINIVTRNGEQLSTIINDILDLSKVEAGHLTLEYTDTDPHEIAADVVSLLRVKANEKDLVLEFNSDSSTPTQIVTDTLRVRQILMNVVGNAVKFTHVGSVKIRSFGTTEPSGSTLYYEITDTGIGIPEEDKEKIFEAFVQADGTLVRNFGGTGLGLALSRQLARSLGGDVAVTKSSQGKGSTFLISIPDQPSLKSSLPSQRKTRRSDVELAPDALAGIRVLAVDDAADNRQLIWYYLDKHGAIIDFAENGFAGYKKALAGNFDVVLMDIQMPEMDGYTATQKLREAGFRKPIIALTAHAMSEVRKKCLNVGCTDHLTKPINPAELIGAVSKYSRPNTQ